MSKLLVIGLMECLMILVCIGSGRTNKCVLLQIYLKTYCYQENRSPKAASYSLENST